MKFILYQRLSTIPQQHWVDKLFGFDFTIEHYPGSINTVPDALSYRGVDDTSIDSRSLMCTW
jgi:hypothetical protein